MSRLPSFGSFAISKGVSPLQSFSGNCLKCHGCIGGGTRSLTSCIACPTCLRTAFMLRSSRTTLLMPRNTPHMACWDAEGSMRLFMWHKDQTAVSQCLTAIASQPVKLCTDRHWFSRPTHQVCPVYWEVPTSTAKLQRTMRFRMGSHLLPIEQGRHLRLPRHRRVCRLCHTGALGDERHILLECPALADLRDEYSPLVAECSGVMARLVWARNQPMVSRYIIACLDRMSC